MDIRTRSQRLIGILVLMCFLAGLFPWQVQAESFTAEVVVNSMVVRSGPAVSYSVVARLSKASSNISFGLSVRCAQAVFESAMVSTPMMVRRCLIFFLIKGF